MLPPTGSTIPFVTNLDLWPTTLRHCQRIKHDEALQNV